MSQNTLAEYRNLYRDRHGIECPLSDAQVRAALVSEGVGEDVWPLDLGVLTAMETTVAASFPAVDQTGYEHGDTLQAPQDLALDNPTAVGFDVNFGAATGGSAPLSYQLQIALSEDGPWEDHGDAQANDDEIVVGDLETATTYFARVVVTDALDEEAISNVDSQLTS